MDFHKLVSKLKEIEPTNVFNPQGKTVEAKPVERVALSEDAQMRVLAGVSSILEEGRRISDRQEVIEAKKKGNEYAIGMAAAKKQAGMGDKPATGLPKKVVKKGHEIAKAIKKNESEIVDGEALAEEENTSEFQEKFKSMVEAKKDKMKVKKDKKIDEVVTLKPGAKERLEKEKKDREEAEERRKNSPPVNLKKPPMPVKEASKPDFLDLDKDGNKKEPMKSAAKSKGGDKKDSGKKGMSAKQQKFFGKKKTVKESVERKLSFVDCLRIVKESGGQQQIDPVDSALWNWAQRVAATKIGSGIRADAYAAKVYESYGGEFQLYDVLSENQK